MGAKSLLIFTNHFYPENFKVNDIAFQLSSEGHEVTVITGIPNYPQGKFYPGYGLFKKRKEHINGVKVIRLPLIPRGNGKSLRLILNYLSYAVAVCCYSVYIAFRKKFDVIFVHHTSPIFIGIGAIIVKKIQKIRLHFWNLDLWPESIIATTRIRSKLFYSILDKLVRWIYSHCDTMLIGSKGFEQSILEKGCDKGKIRYFPNWAEDVFTSSPSPANKATSLTLTIPDGFKVMFAGNIGEAQDFENIIKAAELLKNTNIKWLIVGDGRKKSWVEETIAQLELTNNVFLLGRYPLDKMPELFRHADAMLVSLKDEPIFKLTVPAKVQAYMASGKPILAMLNGEGASLIGDADCGRACNAEDYRSLAREAAYLADLPGKELDMLGSNGLNYYREHFDKDKNLEKLSRLLQDA